MTSHARYSPSPADLTEDARDRFEPDPDELGALPLEVMDVVQHGTGGGSRIELTIVVSDRRVRLTGLLAKYVLSYRRVSNAAMEQGVVLPWLRTPANEVWRGILAAAMERARIEPLLEGEEVADAVAAEIRRLLEHGERGRDAADLMAGKVIERRGCLLVSPSAVVGAVRKRLVDDVLLQATIAEAAATHLGMRQTRPRLAGAGLRPRAWAFPLPLPGSRELGEADGAPHARVVPLGSNDGPRDLHAMSRPANELGRGSVGSNEKKFMSDNSSAGERPFVRE